MDPRTLRRHFFAGQLAGLRVVWPVLSVLIGLMLVFGLADSQK